MHRRAAAKGEFASPAQAPQRELEIKGQYRNPLQAALLAPASQRPKSSSVARLSRPGLDERAIGADAALPLGLADESAIDAPADAPVLLVERQTGRLRRSFGAFGTADGVDPARRGLRPSRGAAVSAAERARRCDFMSMSWPRSSCCTMYLFLFNDASDVRKAARSE